MGDVVHTYEIVAQEVHKVLYNLKLNQPNYQVLFNENELTTIVWQSLSDYPANAAAKLTLRFLSLSLYNACQSQNEAILAAVYDWLGGFLYRYIFPRLNREPEQAKDLTNDCLEIICKNLNKVRFPESFIKWLSSVAQNQLRTYFRDSKVTIKPPKTNRQPTASAYNQPIKSSDKKDAQADEADEIDPAIAKVKQQIEFVTDKQTLELLEDPNVVNPETLLLKKEQIIILMDGIKQIRAGKRADYYKEIIYGTFFLGLNDKELAERLNVPVSDIPKMRYQALLLLRRNRVWLDKLR